MKKLLLCFFIVISGVMTATEIKTIVAGPTAVAISVLDEACGQSNGEIHFGTVTGGVAPYTYSIDNGATYSSVTDYIGLSANTYGLAVKDANGDIYNTVMSIMNNSGPTNVSMTITDETCNAANGSVSIGTVTGGLSPYTYSFAGSGYSPTTTYTNLASGSYMINVKDNRGCIYTTSAIITNQAGPTNIANTVVNETCGAANGSITLGVVTGGTAPYTYSFNGSAFTTTTSYNGLIAGSYSIDVKDTNGCIYSTFITVINTSGPTDVALTTSDPSSCSVSDGSVTFSTVTGGSAPYTYNFDGSGYTSSTTYSGLSAGSYPLDVKDANGCVYTTVVSINSVGGPTAIATNVVNSACSTANGSVTLGVVTGGTSPYEYDFNNLGYSTTTTYPGLAAGTYDLNVKDANGCIYPTTIVVNNVPGPTGIVTTPTDATCGLSDGAVTLGTVTGGTAPYEYDFNNLGYATTTSYTGLAGGTYTLNVKDANGCIYPTVVSISSVGGVTDIATNVVNSTCGAADGSVSLGVVTGGTSPYEYDFNNLGYSTTISYAGLTAGSYTLKVKDANGCVYQTAVSISSPGGPTDIAITVVNSTGGASNGSVTIGAVTGGTAPYTYSFNGSPFTGTTFYGGLIAGSYTIIVKDANDCTYTTTAAVTGSPCPTSIATTIVNASCATADGSVTIDGVTGGTAPYTYNFNGGGYTTTTSYTGLIAGSYPIDVKDSNGCIYNTSATIINSGGPTAIATTIVNSNCGAADGSVTLGAVTGGTPAYTYNFNGIGFSGTTTYCCLATGTYTLVVMDANGCTYTTSITILENTGPTAIATTIVDASCAAADGSITLGTVTGGTAPYTYNFNSGVYTSATSYTGLTAGTYTIAVKDANGCVYNTSITIINSNIITAIATTIVDSNCNVSDGSITIDGVTGGSAPYTYAIDGSPFSATTVYTGLAAGSYTMIVKDVNGCIYSTTIIIANIGGPTSISTTTTNSNCGASDGSLTLGVVTGGTGPYTYSFAGSAYTTTTTYSGLAAGSHSLVVKDVNGCIYNTNVTIADQPGLTNIAHVETNSTCGNANGSVTLGAVTGGTAPYEYNFNNMGYPGSTSYTGLAAGSYPIIVKDANGCTFTTTVTISDSPGPTALAITVVNTSCGNSNGSITLGAVTGGTPPYTYQFNGSGTFTTTTFYGGLPPGSYPISATDANGCTFTTSATVIDNPNTPTVNISYADPFSTSDTSQQSVTLTGTGNYTGGTYSATPGLEINPNTGSIQPSASAAGTYTVTYTIPASGSCPAVMATTNVTIVNATDGIKLNAFIDSNSNGIQDGGEENFTNGDFHYELNNNGTIHDINTSTGMYTIYEATPTNSYDVSFTVNSDVAAYYTVNPSSYTNLTVPGGSGITTYNFPLTVVPYTDLAVYLYPYGAPPRPGFTYENYIYVKNRGNQPTPAGTLTFTNDSKVTITNVSPSATMTPTGFTYDFPSLAPNQSLYVIVTMQVPTIPTVQLGDLLTNTVSVAIPAGDVDTANNNSSLTQTIVGSYDPNDKNEVHGPQILHSTFTSNDYLSYIIQFENTGTANAVTVRVEDLLDAKLDETSIKMIDASHNYTLDRVGNDLTWTFDGIDLPPSVAGTSIGKGFINFQIKPKAGYAVGDIIKNTAYIYFDFNPAIITNEFSTEFVAALGVAGFENSQFSAYPNPTTGIITIALKNNAATIDSIIVTDVLGKTVQSNTIHNSNATIDLSQLTKGFYFVKIQAEGQVKTLKVIKE